MKPVKLFESFINEADSKEVKIARDILSDLLNEWDPWELMDMLPGEAADTVESFGHKGAEAKKITKALLQLIKDQEFGTDESVVTESKFKVGKTYNWHGMDWDPKAKENVKVVKPVEITKIEGNKVFGRFEGSSEEYIIRDADKYLKP